MERKQIEIKKYPAKVNAKTKYYKLEIECDANDGDYMTKTKTISESSMDDLTILMLAYFSMHSQPTNWEKPSKYYVVGGRHIADNYRFDNDNDEENWLESYARENGYLIFAGMCDDYCHSICSIIITYYDENGVAFNCTLPDLGAIFESEKEFVEYVRELDSKES